MRFLLNKFLYWFRDGIVEKTTPLENQIPENTIDLMLFMGQSNMAGRGVAAQSIVCQSGHGYEFRAVSDPTKLYDIVEPFGISENNAVVNDDSMKTGSMVSAFVEAYYTYTKNASCRSIVFKRRKFCYWMDTITANGARGY